MGGDRKTDLRVFIWLLAVSFALHEAEEWNIALWLRTHFIPTTEFTDRAARTLLVLFALLALLYTALTSLLLSTRGMLYALLPLFIGIAFGNALNHVFWFFYFSSYAPGVVASAFLAIPLTVYVSVRAVRERLVPGWFVGLLYAAALLQPLAAARAGATLPDQALVLQRVGLRFSEWLWGPA